ncbi:hypothetical protein [Oryza sativa Japonica Group]|uniref:Uncharacterized protein n=1 Tax=Oryza sativa subsp. japonica TaxID=39947 RepID=Q9FPA1_ORYSJ|nr:hypothetical protein [Oryza sativa Japonica Group]
MVAGLLGDATGLWGDLTSLLAAFALLLALLLALSRGAAAGVVEEVLLTWELGVTGGDDDGFGFFFSPRLLCDSSPRDCSATLPLSRLTSSTTTCCRGRRGIEKEI